MSDSKEDDITPNQTVYISNFSDKINKDGLCSWIETVILDLIYFCYRSQRVVVFTMFTIWINIGCSLYKK